MSSVQSYLILTRSSPYGSHKPKAALDMALTAAAFEQEVSIVFLDDGVLQLLPNQDTESSSLKNISKMISALKIYEVKHVYVHIPSAEKTGLDLSEAPNDVETITDESLQDLVSSSNHIMVF
jgi:tRNA 2-thiouridine synthesizing protein C